MNNHNPYDTRGQDLAKQDAADRALAVRKKEAADLKWLLNSRQGRRIMWRIFEITGPFRPVFDPIAMKMAFLEGGRNMGNLFFHEVMEVHPDMFTVMWREQVEDLQNLQKLKEQQDAKRDGNGDQFK